MAYAVPLLRVGISQKFHETIIQLFKNIQCCIKSSNEVSTNLSSVER